MCVCADTADSSCPHTLLFCRQITAYNTVFNTTGIPDGFSFILAIDWFVDRLRTTVNVTGDAVVSGMVAHMCPIDEENGSDIPSVDSSGDAAAAAVTAPVTVTKMQSDENSDEEF